MLRRDYSLECGGEKYNEYLPAALTLLLGFALLLPIALSGFLYCHRNDLYTPKTKRKLGWLYYRFQKGSEFWEVHEVIRKMLLTGLLIYLPTHVRSPSAIVVCTICCCTLNYYHPHRNPVVFWIDEICALLTTGKYLVTVFGNSMGDDVSVKDRQYLGYLLIGMDLFIIIGGQICIICLFYLIGSDVNTIHQDIKQKQIKATAVVPLGVNNDSFEIEQSEGKQVNSEVKRSNTSLSLKTIQKAVLHNKVSVLEIVSEEHRQKNIKVILERKKSAGARVRQRLMVRRKSKQIKQQQQTEEKKLTPEQLVSIEKTRLHLYEKIQTGQKLQAIFNQLDIDHSGMLSKNEFNTLILKVFEKKTAMLNGNMLDLIWEAIWEQRKHGANDEIDASTLSHWLQL